MNETIMTILRRRSIRFYTEKPVAREALSLVLQCGLYAANGGNHQVPRFTVIENTEVLERLKQITREEFRKMKAVPGQYHNTAILNAQKNPEYDFQFHAPVLIIVTAPDGWPNGMADCACALQNMQVAAASLGLGSCYVNQLHWLTGNEALRSYVKTLGIPGSESIYGCMVLGHTDRALPPAAPRRENRVTFIS